MMKDYKSCNKLDNQMHPKFYYKSFATCESCIMYKLPKTLFSRTREQAKGILELIHFDVCDLMPVQARGDSFYFITFTNDFFIFLMGIPYEV